MRPIEQDAGGFSYDPQTKAYRQFSREGHVAGWVVEGSYDLVDGRLVVLSLSVRSSSDNIPPNGITGTLLRSIHPADITDRIRTGEAGYATWLAAALSDVDLATVDETGLEHPRRILSSLEVLANAPRSGPTGVRGAPRLTDEFLADVAKLHIQQIADDGSYGAKTRLAKELNKPYNTVKSWLGMAKARGLYPVSDNAKADRTE